MFAFQEFSIDPDLFYEKSEEIQILSKIEQLLLNLSNDTLEHSVTESLEILSKHRTSNFVFAKLIYKFCFSRPKEIEKYILLVHKIKAVENSLFKMFRRIIFIDYKTQILKKIKNKPQIYQGNFYSKQENIRPELIFILNKLIEMNDLSPIDLIHSIIPHHFLFVHYFDHQQMLEVFKDQSIQFKEDLNELKLGNWQRHKQMISEGFHHSNVVKSIEKDDVETLSSIIDSPNFNYNDIVSFSIYDRVKYPFNDITLLELAAFCSSLSCFKVLLEHNCQFTNRIGSLAIAGGNKEIVQICEDNNSEFKNGIKYAIKYHRPELLSWLLETKKEKLPPFNHLLNKCVKYSCFSIIIDYLPKCTQVNELSKLIIKDGNNLLHVFLRQFKEIRYTNLLKMLKITCKTGNIELFKYFNRNEFNKSKFSELFLLHKATFYESEDIVQILLNRKEIKLDEKDTENGETAFHIACRNSSPEIARILMNHLCQINNQSNKTGQTGLHFACDNGNIKIIQIILEQPHLMADIKDYVEFETPLHVAARRGFYEIVDLLLHNGFYINELAKCRMTPLHFACMYGNEKTVETLLHFDPENIEINSTTQNQEDGVIDPKYGCNMTPLHFVCQYGSEDIVSLLMNHKQDNVHTLKINIKGIKGGTQYYVTPIHIACQNGSTEVARVLLSNIKTDYNIKIVNLITDPNLIVDKDLIPLHFACLYGFDAIVKMLIAKPTIHIDSKAMMKDDIYNSLHMAAMNGHPKVIELLLKHPKGSKLLNMQSNIKKETPLHIACKYGRFDVVDLLLKQKGIDVNILDADLLMPLHIACIENAADIADLLIHFPKININYSSIRYDIGGISLFSINRVSSCLDL